MKPITQFIGHHFFLSNFYPEDDGLTVEHRFQAAKTHELSQKGIILSARTPAIAKRIGRKVSLRPDWEDVKIPIMLGLLITKFYDARLRAMLLETGDAELVEGNYWNDRFWGVDIRTGRGENHLGQLLMTVRNHYSPK